MSKQMVLKPRISEKAYGLSVSSQVYTLHVPTDASKVSVAQAIEEQFSVTVTGINMLILKGKTKRTVRRGGKQKFGTRNNMKKAYVTLKKGESLPFFANEEDKPKKKATAKGAKK